MIGVDHTGPRVQSVFFYECTCRGLRLSNNRCLIDESKDRPSCWTVPPDGTFTTFKSECLTGAAKCMRLYFEYLSKHPNLVEQARKELAGKRLGCWCSPSRCHGDVLAGLANGSSLEEIRREWSEAGYLSETRNLFGDA